RQVLSALQNAFDFPKLNTYSKSGEIDSAIEEFVRPDAWDDDIAAWQLMAEMAGKICDLEKKTYGKGTMPKDWTSPAYDFRRFASGKFDFALKFVSERCPSTKSLDPGQRLAVRAQQVDSEVGASYSFYVISGRVRELSVTKSIIFSGSSIKLQTAADS